MRDVEARAMRHRGRQQRGGRVAVQHARPGLVAEDLAPKSLTRHELRGDAPRPQHGLWDALDVTGAAEGHIGLADAELGPQAACEVRMLAGVDQPIADAAAVELVK